MSIYLCFASRCLTWHWISCGLLGPQWWVSAEYGICKGGREEKDIERTEGPRVPVQNPLYGCTTADNLGFLHFIIWPLLVYTHRLLVLVISHTFRMNLPQYQCKQNWMNSQIVHYNINYISLLTPPRISHSVQPIEMGINSTLSPVPQGS